MEWSDVHELNLNENFETNQGLQHDKNERMEVVKLAYDLYILK